MLFLTMIGMLLETLGIGLVVPALALMTEADLAARYPAVAPWLAALGNPSQERLIVASMLTLIGVYLAKALFLGYFAWLQARFVFGLQASVSQRLFAGYLRQPYTFHLQRNSAQLIRNTIGQASRLATVVQGSLVLAGEALVLLGISILLVVVEPLGALLVLSVLSLAGWIFNRYTRPHVLRWGKAHQLHEGMRIQHIQQGLGSAKDLKLMGREEDFLAQYEVHNVGTARVGERQAALQALPRLGLELLAIVGLSALVLVMIAQAKPMGALLPTLGLFAVSAFRLLPSVNRVLGAIHGIRYSFPVVDILHGEFELIRAVMSPRQGAPLPFKHTLSLDRVSFQYPSAPTHALRGISLSIRRGASVGFIGESGAGKSTIVDVILGLLVPSSGSVRVDGNDIHSSVRGWQDQIGYVPQSIYLTDDTLRRNIAFGLPPDQIDETAIRRAITAAQLDTFVNELPLGLETLVGERGVRLSGGQRQRIGIARALYHDPPVLVLDEATSSLDTATEHGVMEAVRTLRGDKTLIIVAHRLSTVERCDRIFRLEKGCIVDEGETATVLAKAAGRAAP